MITVTSTGIIVSWKVPARINNNILVSAAIPLTSISTARLACTSVANRTSPDITVSHNHSSKADAGWEKTCPPSNIPAVRMCKVRNMIRTLRRYGKSRGSSGKRQTNILFGWFIDGTDLSDFRMFNHFSPS